MPGLGQGLLGFFVLFPPPQSHSPPVGQQGAEEVKNPEANAVAKFGIGGGGGPCRHQGGALRGLGGAGNPTEERRLFFFFKGRYSLGEGGGSKK